MRQGISPSRHIGLFQNPKPDLAATSGEWLFAPKATANTENDISIKRLHRLLTDLIKNYDQCEAQLRSQLLLELISQDLLPRPVDASTTEFLAPGDEGYEELLHQQPLYQAFFVKHKKPITHAAFIQVYKELTEDKTFSSGFIARVDSYNLVRRNKIALKKILKQPNKADINLQQIKVIEKNTTVGLKSVSHLGPVQKFLEVCANIIEALYDLISSKKEGVKLSNTSSTVFNRTLCTLEKKQAELKARFSTLAASAA